MLKIASKSKGEVFFHDIQLKALWGHCWWQNLPYVECFLELLEAAIKNSISQVLPHEELYLDYDLEANDSWEDASTISLTFNCICADNIQFQVVENNLILEGPEYRSFFSKLTSFRRKKNENIEKTI